MKAICILCAGLLAAGGAAAQALETPAAAVPPALAPAPAPLVLVAPRARAFTAVPVAPFAVAPAPGRVYLENQAESDAAAIANGASKSAFGVWRTDPKLVAGIDFTRNLGLEAGYVNLYNRGTFYSDYASHPEDAAGAQGVRGLNSYVAAKLTLPVGERFEAYAKAGNAYSRFNHYDEHGAWVKEPDAGSYAGAGAQYRLNEKTTVSGAYERYGDSARWGSNTNNNSVSAKVKIGF